MSERKMAIVTIRISEFSVNADHYSYLFKGQIPVSDTDLDSDWAILRYLFFTRLETWLTAQKHKYAFTVVTESEESSPLKDYVLETTQLGPGNGLDWRFPSALRVGRQLDLVLRSVGGSLIP